MALLWLGLFRERVVRNCFPHVSAKSLVDDVMKVINSIFLEGYILARAAQGQGSVAVRYTDPDRRGSVESGVERLRAMYEDEAIGMMPFAEEPLGVESIAEALVRETVYGPELVRLEERELLKVHLTYALWAGYRLAVFERRLSGEES